MKQYALVTGASKGIGKEIAIQLAAKGFNLMLVSRSETELQQIVPDLEKYSVTASYLACDLSLPQAAQQVSDWVNLQTKELSVVVNNAGFGIWGGFKDLPLRTQMEMLQLNINAVVELSHQLLPLLLQQKQAYLMNVASTAAYQAMPTMALYAASKSFVLSFTRALRYELKDTNVSVSCLSPGPTDTAFASRAGLDAFADLAAKFNMSAALVASMALKGMFNKKAEILPGFLNKVSAIGATLLPKSLIERISAGIYK
ncbi:MAG: SDR family oxidoreductase [Pedobacter sp.]|nr:MAG: SDR family oxidoreductase [Pedobacter sp.]